MKSLVLCFFVLLMFGCGSKPDAYMLHAIQFDAYLQIVENNNAQLYASINDLVNNEVNGLPHLKPLYNNSLQIRLESEQISNTIDSLQKLIIGTNVKDSASLESIDIKVLNQNAGIDDETLFELKKSILHFKKFLIQFINDTVQYKNIIDWISQNLSTEKWQSVKCLNGEKVSKGEILACLLKLKADIKVVETEILTFLLNRYDFCSYKFNRMAAFVVPNSLEIPQNSTYYADIFPGIHDTTSAVLFEIDGKQQPVGKYRFHVTEKSGKYEKKGFFIFKGLTGEPKKVPFSIEYQVLDWK